MSQEAFNFDYEKILSSHVAYELSVKGKIVSAENFVCPDPKCNIHLKLSNYNKLRKEGAKRFYFYPVPKGKTHVVNCSYVNAKNNYQGVRSLEDERKLREHYLKNKIIEMRSDKPNSISSSLERNSKNQEPYDNQEEGYKSQDKQRRVKKEKSRFHAVSSLVYHYLNSSQEEREKYLIEVEKEKRTLNDLFINLTETKVISTENRYKVFYGKARLYTDNRKGKESLVHIEFTPGANVKNASGKLFNFKLFTNVKFLSKSVQDLINTKNYYPVFGMGKLIDTESGFYKWKSFKSTMYESIVVLESS